MNAKIDANGKVEMFRLKCLCYGVGFNSDGGTIAVGSLLTQGYVVDAKGSDAPAIKPAPMNPGFPEYYGRMVFDLNG